MRKRSRSRTRSRARRVASVNAIRTIRTPSPRSVVRVHRSPIRPLYQPNTLSDLRTFHPARHIRPAGATRRSATRLVQRRYKIGFADPRNVSICQKRKARRRAIFAAGRAGTQVRKPKFNQWSEIKC